MPLRVTTSWDDGHILDQRLVDLLDRYQLTGTFYICRDYTSERLSEEAIRDIAARHEIGAHTLTHPDLTTLSMADARNEMQGSKHWLEDVIGREVTAFCYPRGACNAPLHQLCAETGFRIARGVEKYSIIPGDPYELSTTVQVYPLPLRPLPSFAWWQGWRSRTLPLRQALHAAHENHIPRLAVRNWVSWAKAWVEVATTQDGTFHLWGHSWEIDAHDQWDDLEALFRHLSKLDFQAAINSDLREVSEA